MKGLILYEEGITNSKVYCHAQFISIKDISKLHQQTILVSLEVAVGSKGLSMSYRSPGGKTWFLSHIRTLTCIPAALQGRKTS